MNAPRQLSVTSEAAAEYRKRNSAAVRLRQAKAIEAQTSKTVEPPSKSNAQRERERQAVLQHRIAAKRKQPQKEAAPEETSTAVAAAIFQSTPRPWPPPSIAPVEVDLGAMSIDAKLFDHSNCRAAIRASNASRWVAMNQPSPRELRNVSSLVHGMLGQYSLSWQQEVFDLILEERPHAGASPVVSRVLRYVRNQKAASDTLTRGCYNPFGVRPLCSREATLSEAFGLGGVWQPPCCQHLVPVDHCASEADDQARRFHGCSAEDEPMPTALTSGAAPDRHAQATDPRVAPFLRRVGNASWFVFTFVRDPIDAAVSAYLQLLCCSRVASLRQASPRPRYLDMGCESPAAATQRFRAYVDELADAGASAQFGDQFYHAFPQALKVNAAGRSAVPRFDAIGSIERLRDDLKRIAAASGFAPGAPGVDAAFARGHSSKRQHAGAQKNCSRIDLSEPALLRKLCTLYAADYVCFGLARPQECSVRL